MCHFRFDTINEFNNPSARALYEIYKVADKYSCIGLVLWQLKNCLAPALSKCRTRAEVAFLVLPAFKLDQGQVFKDITRKLVFGFGTVDARNNVSTAIYQYAFLDEDVQSMPDLLLRESTRMLQWSPPPVLVSA